MKPSLPRSLLALLKASPRADGWCRTRWSGATLAAPLAAKRGLTVSAETLRRWGHEVGWVWKRAKLVAKAADPHRVERRARIRFVCEPWRRCEALVCADALDSHLLPQVGDTWRPQGRQPGGMTPGTHDKPSLAGTLDLATGTWRHTLGPRHTHVLFRDVLQALEEAYPMAPSQPIDVVGDHRKIQKAKAVEEWFAKHPRIRRLLLPTYGPRVIEDCCQL